MPSPWMTCLKKRAVPVPAHAVSYDHPLGLVLGLRPCQAGNVETGVVPSILGMVKTTWRWGTSRRSVSLIHSPHSSSLLPCQAPGGVGRMDGGESRLPAGGRSPGDGGRGTPPSPTHRLSGTL